MSWLWGGSSSSEASPNIEAPSAPLDMSGGMDFGFNTPSVDTTAHTQSSDPFSSPVLALDQIKHAGVPVTRQMTPYLQMDPSIFVSSAPQYIMPDGGATGKGKFEFALGHIGWAVAGGFGAGCARGAIGEFFNKETQKMSGKPWMTRMVNATVKHGSGFAQPSGAVVFLYSALEIGLRSVRADDDLNGIGAGALTGALYRSPHGLKASGVGAATGVVLALAWLVGNPDSRGRLQEMFGMS